MTINKKGKTRHFISNKNEHKSRDNSRDRSKSPKPSTTSTWYEKPKKKHEKVTPFGEKAKEK